jgi:hypothetical protein
LGSFLLMSPVASSRTRAASLGGTSSTRSPADSSCWASRWPTPPAPSTAQVRSGHACAHASSRSACAAQARTRSWPSGSSAGLIATAVCEALCGSTPIITDTTAMPLLPNPDLGAKTAAGTPNFRELAGARASFEPRHGEAPARWHVVKKPGPTKGPAGGYRASPPGPLNATTPSSLPSRPGPAAPATIRRVRARPEPRQHSQSVLGMLIEPCRGFATQTGRRIVI